MLAVVGGVIYRMSRLRFGSPFSADRRVRFNAMGPKSYPEGTNHFSPYSALYKPEQRTSYRTRHAQSLPWLTPSRSRNHHFGHRPGGDDIAVACVWSEIWLAVAPHVLLHPLCRKFFSISNAVSLAD